MFFVSCQQKEIVQFSLDSEVSGLEVFAEGIISTSMYERDIAIHPVGNQLIYTLSSYDQKRRALVALQKVEGKWSEPQILAFSGKYQDLEPFYSTDGQQLFFASDRPMDEERDRSDYNIWVSQWQKGDWSSPEPLDTMINTTGDEFYPSVAANGNLYFTATRPDGVGREDIFVSQLKNGKYQKPLVLDSTINTATYEFNAYISPDEDLLIFSSFGRADGLGGGDLYYSKKGNNGLWLQSIHLEAPINSTALDYCPFVDWNNNIFYLTSNRSGQNSERSSFQDFVNYNSGPGNGMGDIYRIAIDKLDL